MITELPAGDNAYCDCSVAHLFYLYCIIVSAILQPLIAIFFVFCVATPVITVENYLTVPL